MKSKNMISMTLLLLTVSLSTENSNENLNIVDLNVLDGLGLGKRFHID